MGEKEEKSTKNNEGEKKNESDINTTVLKFDMHCEGCAKKVRKSIKKLQGVEDVKTDCSTNKLVVTGKVDSVKLKEIVEEKMKKPVELVSLTPNKAAKEGGNGGSGEKKSENKKPDEQKPVGKKVEVKSDDKKFSEGKSDDKKNSEVKSDDTRKSEVKSDDKKKSNGKSNDKKSEAKEKENEKPKEPQVATVQLKTRVHCEGCSQKIKKIASKCKGVQEVNVDLQKDLIILKGAMNMKELLPYLNVKLKRAVELAPTKKDEGTGGEKKSKEGGDKSEKPKEGGGKSEKTKDSGGEKKDNGGDKKDSGGNNTNEGNGEKKKVGGGDIAGPSNENIGTRIEVNKMEHNPYPYNSGYSYFHDPRQQWDGYSHQVVESHQASEYWNGPVYSQEYSQPPQMFSDENPNACSVM